MPSEATSPMRMRPELVRDTLDASKIGEAVRPLSTWERFRSNTAVRRLFILVVLATAWQAFSVPLDNPLIFPTFTETLGSLWHVTITGELPARVVASLKVLLMGYAAGVALAAVLTTFAVSTRIGTAFLPTLTKMCNQLPATAPSSLARR